MCAVPQHERSAEREREEVAAAGSHGRQQAHQRQAPAHAKQCPSQDVLEGEGLSLATPTLVKQHTHTDAMNIDDLFTPSCMHYA